MFVLAEHIAFGSVDPSIECIVEYSEWIQSSVRLDP